MQAVVLREPGTALEFDPDFPDPVTCQSTGNSDLSQSEVIDVTACGVCHSDLHVADGEFKIEYPRVLGHEVTGMHHELGPVMVYAPWGCGRCEQCGDGFEMICPDASEAGIFSDGGYAEQMWIRDRRYLSLIDGLDPIASAPLACGGLTAYRAVQHGLVDLRRQGSRPRRALVIGAGGLGQFALRYLRLLTDAEVYALDLSESKCATALEMGAHGAVTNHSELPPCDVIVDFIGADTTLGAAVEVVARRGLVVVVGLWGGRVPFGFGAVPHETRFMSSVWGSRAQLDDLLELARREPQVVAPVETLPLRDAQLAHDRLRAGAVSGRMVLTVSPESTDSQT